MGSNRRHDRLHRALYGAIAGGSAGTVEMLLFTSRTQALPDLGHIGRSGGQLRDKGAPFFDLACWLADDRPPEVHVGGDCLIDQRFAEAGDFDPAMIILRLSKGGYCHFNFSRRTTCGHDERIEVFGSGGRLESRSPARFELVGYAGDQMIAAGLHEHWIDRFCPSYASQLDVFLGEIVNPTGTFPAVEDGFAAAAIAEAGMRSMQERRPVEIDLEV